ncbi:DNA-binding protein [Chlorobium sp. N1]|uniref:DNA-binding protein n=2 Tax=Chlorobium sp. N1 TaxID=2491138 RepID=UPI00103BBA2D|nr:DNA-binding protein [Chlorobium sp. N1]TCD46931.1 DNA-binding protein [Chlorobium sp. N1]
MRPVEFTTEEIVKAGQELQAAGRNITGFALRQKIGGGNPSRLKQVWDEYLSSQAEVKAEPVAELPPEVADAVAAVSKSLADRLMELAVEVNDKAVKAAERRVTDVIRSMGEQREQAERELVDAAQMVEELEARLDESSEQAADLDHQLAEVKANNQAQAVELAQVKERLAIIEDERNRYSQQVEQMRAERDTAREESAMLRGEVNILQAQSSELMRTFGTSRTQAAKKS